MELIFIARRYKSLIFTSMPLLEWRRIAPRFVTNELTLQQDKCSAVKPCIFRTLLDIADRTRREIDFASDANLLTCC